MRNAPSVFADPRCRIWHIAETEYRFHGLFGLEGISAETGTELDAGNPAAENAIDRVSSRPDFLILGYPWLYAMQLRANGTSEYCSDLKINDAVLCKHFAVAYTPELPTSPCPNTPPSFIFPHATFTVTRHPFKALCPLCRTGTRQRPGRNAHFRSKLHGDRPWCNQTPHLNTWPMLLEGWMRTRGLLTPE